jgi:CDP-diacylglycerol--serine O-phosphatidyltransferase
MVSNIRYRSFKDFDVRHRRQFFQLVVLVMIGALAVVKWELALLVLFGGYAILGPAREAVIVVKRWGKKKEFSDLGVAAPGRWEERARGDR